MQFRPLHPLTSRILSRLEVSEWRETDPWLRDDYRIAWITVLLAAYGRSHPDVTATYRVLGLHPEKVWPAIVARRRAQLGSLYEQFFAEDRGALPPKKPARSVRPCPHRADRAA